MTIKVILFLLNLNKNPLCPYDPSAAAAGKLPIPRALPASFLRTGAEQVNKELS